MAKAPETYRTNTGADADSLGAERVAANACRFCKVADHPDEAGRARGDAAR